MTTEDRIQYAFVAGEVAKEYLNRSDLSKYDLGMKLCKNFYCDPRGGISTRVGSELVGQYEGEDTLGKMFRFRGTVSDLTLVFGDYYMRVVQDGGYAVESPVTVTGISQTDPAVATTGSAHGYSTGDWVYFSDLEEVSELHNRIFEIVVLTPTTFEIVEPGYGDVDGTGFPAVISGNVSRVYTLTTPYPATALADLSFEQTLNDVRLTHPDYTRRLLSFTSATSWSIAEITAASALTKPTGVTLTPSAVGTTGIAVVVTAVDADGNESIPSEYALTQTSVNYSTTAGTLQITWTPVADAVKYNVYRSVLIDGTAEVTKGELLGYIGTAYGAQFTDTNITPDFTKTPPVHIDPFAPGAITFIGVTAGGTGYAKSDTISVSGGGGTGFDGYPIVADSGAIVGISIVNGGSGYSSPVTVNVTTSGGAGATFAVTVGPDTGLNPKLFKTFQRRGIYFGTDNNPNSLWASRPNEYNNYDRSTVVTAADPYSFTIDSVAVKPIKHAVALRNGLLIFNDDGVTQLRAESGKAVTGSSAIAEPQVYSTVSDVSPLAYNLDVLFLTEGSETVYAMLYTEYTESFKLQDISILASHLMGPDKEIKRFEATQRPANLIYMPRSDGRELTLTYLREQEVFAWAWNETQGYYLDTVVVTENGTSVRYQLVRRYLRGVWRQYIERVPVREDSQAEDYWGVDCGLRYPLTEGTVTLYPAAPSGTTTITASAAYFTAGNVGDIIYIADGKFQITAFTSSTEVDGTWLRETTDLLPQTDKNQPTPAEAGDWCIATPTTTVTGLWHLEGETVSVCADGDAFVEETVTNGTITLDFAATKIIVGLPYTCDFSSMPLISNQANIVGKPKHVYAVFPRLLRSRGMEFGTDFDNLVVMKDRTDEDWGEELALRSDITEVMLADDYSLDKYLVGRQRWPLPATILGYTVELDYGDVN